MSGVFTPEELFMGFQRGPERPGEAKYLFDLFLFCFCFLGVVGIKNQGIKVVFFTHPKGGCLGSVLTTRTE